jgi:hypothetical protein
MEHAAHITCHFRYHYTLLRLCLRHVFEWQVRYYRLPRTFLLTYLFTYSLLIYLLIIYLFSHYLLIYSLLTYLLTLYLLITYSLLIYLLITYLLI